jgi:hypothetical protein
MHQAPVRENLTKEMEKQNSAQLDALDVEILDTRRVLKFAKEYLFR